MFDPVCLSVNPDFRLIRVFTSVGTTRGLGMVRVVVVAAAVIVVDVTFF